MADPSYAVNGFLGGEISQFAQGRWDRPDYKVALNVCFNAFPVEIGAWTRRPGTQHAGTTRGGNNGRVIKFDFQQSSAYTMEFTDGHLRFRSGPNLVTTNDTVSVSSISTANPAVVTLAVPVTWATGDVAFFTLLGTSCPLLQNRRFTLTKISTTQFSIADAITGATIDGSTLSVSGLSASALINRVLDIATVYSSSSWQSLRAVQTEITSFLLHQGFQPYQVVVNTQPALGKFASFSVEQSFFEDGPYLDPIPGSTITPSGLTGVVTLTLGFQAYSSTQAYTNGEFVTSSSVGYESIADANVNNTPASSPSFWTPVGFGAPVNGGLGFLTSDVGRLVRLFSEPAAWASTTTYATGTIVSYNPSTLPGENVYYSSLTSSNVGHAPGTDATNWEVVAIGSSQNPALWTWGKITSLSTTGAISGGTGTNIGNMTSGGGLAAAFDGNLSQSASASAEGTPQFQTVNLYVGKNYTGSAKTISQVLVYPSTDLGFVNGGFGGFLYLYASNSAPSNATNGTLLGQTSFPGGNVTPAVTIQSNNTTSTWNYVWVAVSVPGANQFFNTATASICEAVFYSNSASPGTSASVEILGPPLLYNGVVITTWRLGVYSATTGWPNVGAYSDGRLWLSSPSFPNRIDACVANGISGVNNGALLGSVNFAPTDQYGNVTDANGISYVLNSEGANPILWMQPTLQGIVLETQAGEWLVSAPTSGGLSPLNISARKVTKIGGANVLPATTEHTYVFVQRYSVKLMEYFADVFSGKFTAPNLADKAQHITRNGIAELAYVHSATPIIWGRDTTGALFGCTYKRDTLMTSQGPTYYAWHRHGLGSGRSVVSIAAGPSIGGNLDALTMVTADTSGDSQNGVYHVEIMTDTLDELSTLAQSWFLDDAVAPSSVTFNLSSPSPNGGVTLNGLWHLNGETVEAFCAGLDLGSYTVANGSITIPYGDGISAGPGGGLFTNAFAVTNQTGFVVGFQYTSQGQLVRPQDPTMTGTRLGPALGKKREIKTASALFSNLGMSNSPPQTVVQFGTDFDGTLFPAILNDTTTSDPTRIPSNQLSTFSGIWRDSIKSESNFDGMLAWSVTGPLPCNISVVQPWVTAEEAP